jgi:hypothetical protein
MDTAILSATAGLVGSLIGGVSTFALPGSRRGNCSGAKGAYIKNEIWRRERNWGRTFST